MVGLSQPKSVVLLKRMCFSHFHECTCALPLLLLLLAMIICLYTIRIFRSFVSSIEFSEINARNIHVKFLHYYSTYE